MAKYKQQKFSLALDERYTLREQRAIATDVIDFIINRTQKDNKDKKNRSLKKYSKGYEGSLDFKNAGKRKGKVDLTLSEEMLNEMKLVKNIKGKIDIGYDGRRNKLNGKVEGNILGTYGQKKSTGKARDFLGITDKDLRDKILKKYPIDDRLERIKRVLALEKATAAGKALAGVKVSEALDGDLELGTEG